jgi:hypothetical protein
MNDIDINEILGFEALSSDEENVSIIEKLFNSMKDWTYDDSYKTTYTWQEMEKRHHGTCYDTVNYMYYKLKDTSVIPTCYWIGDRTDGKDYPSHTIITTPNYYNKHHNGIVVIEISYKPIRKIHQFKSVNDMINWYIDVLITDWPVKDEIYHHRVFTYLPDNKHYSYNSGNFEKRVVATGKQVSYSKES